MIDGSRSQERITRWIEQMGYQVESEYPVGKYSLDIFLPAIHAAVEVDGPSHGLRRKKDRERDAEIRASTGVLIIRVASNCTLKALTELMALMEERAAEDLQRRRQIAFGEQFQC